MCRWPLAALFLGVSVLSADTLNLKQIKIDFDEFKLGPGSSPVNIGNYYAGGTAMHTNGLNGPDYGLSDQTKYLDPHWVAEWSYTENKSVGSFLYHSPGEIIATKGLFTSLSLAIKGGLSYAPDAYFPIMVLDAGGNILAERDVGYSSGFQHISLPFTGTGAEIVFGKPNGMDASYWQFDDLVTWVDPPQAEAPEPEYAAIAGLFLFGLGILRVRKRAGIPPAVRK